MSRPGMPSSCACAGCHLHFQQAYTQHGMQYMQIPDVSGYEPDQALNVEDLFKVGDLVDVAGTSIGKGFQGMQSV